MAADLSIRSLADVSIDDLCAASNAAFSDYQVSVQMTPEQLQVMLAQNDVDLGLSVGLFDEHQLVGFWINGVREQDGVPMGYDSGTAICKPYRGQGWAGKLATASDNLMLGHGVQDYVLEVLTDNQAAYQMYLRRGFQETRKLRCLRLGTPPAALAPLPSDLEVSEGVLDEVRAAMLIPTECAPSWQHRTRSMSNIGEHVHAVIVRSATHVVGHGLMIRDRGRITQLAAADGYWESPVPTFILDRLCAQADGNTVAAINIDPGATRTLALLDRYGFASYVDQYEMIKRLTPGIAAS